MGPVALFLSLGHVGTLALLALFTAIAVLGQVALPAADGGTPADPAAPAGGEPEPRDDGGEPAEPAARPAVVDEEDAELDALPEANVRTRLRRTQRQIKTIAPIADVFRDPATGRYLTPQEAATERQLAADMRDIRAFYDEHPDLLQTMLERRRTGAQPAAAPAYEDPFADEATLPFDTASDSGRWFLEQHRRQHRENFELRQTLQRLEQGLSGVAERDTQRTLTQAEEAWKVDTLAAAKTAGLTGDDLEDFVNSVYANFRLGRAEKRLDRLDRRQVIEKALRPFKRSRTAGTRQAAAAAGSRVANQPGLPRTGTRDGAAPANPKDTNRVGTIRDGRKDFFARQGLSTPPGGR